jgi:hypothetical protein
MIVKRMKIPIPAVGVLIIPGGLRKKGEIPQT